MDEFEIIRRCFLRESADDTVRLGIGDDGAVLAPAAGRELVCVVDTLVEGVHYPAGLAACDVGFRAVAVNLSDLAAMAARPRWMTLALTLSRNDAEWLDGFAAGLFEAASEWQVPLVGGDITRGEQTVLSVSLIGDVEPGAFLTRSGARPGDDLYVTGTPGDAAGGLALIASQGDNRSPPNDSEIYLRRRFARPAARVEFGMLLAEIATAAIDISDGLFADAGKLLLASRAGASLELTCLPVSPQLRGVFGDDQAVRFALTGGDDYELCFSADPANEEALRAAAARLELPVERIGRVDDTQRLVACRNGERIEFSDCGYRHFRP